MKTLIDNSQFLEIVSAIAEQRTEKIWGETRAGLLIEEDGETRYSEEGQQIFNDEYDKVETLFNECGIYSAIGTPMLTNIDDVQSRFECTDEEAQEVLNKVFTDEWLTGEIGQVIYIAGESMDLKPKEEE